jgi:hypothetical protein
MQLSYCAAIPAASQQPCDCPFLVAGPALGVPAVRLLCDCPYCNCFCCEVQQREEIVDSKVVSERGHEGKRGAKGERAKVRGERGDDTERWWRGRQIVFVNGAARRWLRADGATCRWTEGRDGG